MGNENSSLKANWPTVVSSEITKILWETKRENKNIRNKTNFKIGTIINVRIN